MPTTIVVAGGPSVTLKAIRAIGKVHAAGRCRVIAVNDAVYPCWFSDHLHAADRRWWIANDGVPGFAGIKTSMELTPYPDVVVQENTGVAGFEPTAGALRTGRNSGYQAVQLAAKQGADRIIILGIDFTDGARDHWFGRHSHGQDIHSNTDDWRRLFRELTDDLEARGIEVANAGSASTLTWLRRVYIEDAL